MGSNITGEDELKSCGRKLFGKSFRGVFASDELPRTFKSRQSAIVNLDPRSSGGSHWIAMVAHQAAPSEGQVQDREMVVYGSFGRDVLADQLPGVQYTEDAVEQGFYENNCGQRCLAWLCVYYKHGLGDAMQI